MTDELTQAEIDELERLEKAATPGPWQVRSFDEAGFPGETGLSHPNGWLLDGLPSEQHDTEDRQFIAAARNALPRLLAERAEACRMLKECHKEVAELTTILTELHRNAVKLQTDA